MPRIQVLDQITIDKIAAGEVIERPSYIVKELVENAIDAGATSVNVEIEDGGIASIRITDNGCGIEKEDIQKAFLRHSTSKIRQVEDLAHITSLGFRGEALSSIAAVTKVELTTKPKDELLGCRYVIEGGKEISLSEVGAANGTTFEVRQLFYNVPARRKFLKTPMTEAGHVQDLLLRLALSHPDVSFCFRNNGQEKLRTNGSGKLKEVIYQVYGRDVAANLLEIDFEQNGIHVQGYLGKPVITRGNRNFETFFVNGRYVKSAMISKAVEDAYKDFMMQHKFPFVVLHFEVDGTQVDVNVHPTKMELRFQKQQDVYNSVYEGIHRRLLEPEFIPKVSIPDPVKVQEKAEESKKQEQSPFLLKPKAQPEKVSKPVVSAYPTSVIQSQTENKVEPVKKEPVKPEERNEEYFIKKMRERVLSYHNRSSSAEVSNPKGIFKPEVQKDRIAKAVRESSNYRPSENKENVSVMKAEKEKPISEAVKQKEKAVVDSKKEETQIQTASMKQTISEEK
ncbi:MAG: DNA mismatch repair endonuclease MutL, partial [Ruminococcus sp.]|nr:DNA mismatch repair endonuclease MutL [Ruminococcus sp.]